MADTLSIQPSARPREVTDLAVEQGTRQRTGGGGVADAHLATDKQLCPACQCSPRTVAAGLQGEHPLGLGHCRAIDEVGGARTDVQVAHTWQVQGRRDRAKVDHFQLCLQLSRQDADGRATADKVVQHLPSDFLRKRRHALRYHAMVTREDGDPHVVHQRFDLALQAGQLHRQGLQLPEGARRFGQLLLASQGVFVCVRVNRLTGVEPPGVSHNAVPFNVRGRPATVRTTR